MKKETYSYTDEIQKEVLQLVSKYESLVWYTRSGAPYTDEPSDVWCRRKVKRMDIEEAYPDETFIFSGEEDQRDELSPQWDYQYGFNCGCLAAFRFIRQAVDDDPRAYGGLKNAIEGFPCLDHLPLDI